ncbi:MAG: spiro-SPASM protein [Spirochaetota bacterium]
MKTALVINAILKGSRWTRKIGTFDPVKNLIQKMQQIFPAQDMFIIGPDRTLSQISDRIPGCRKIITEDTTPAGVFMVIYNNLRDYDHAVYMYMDSPLINVEVTRDMLSSHHREFSEYTYPEGFPYGFAPAIIKTELFPKLASLSRNDTSEMGRDSVFRALSKDINSFDLETYFAPRDLKMKRLELSTSLKRNAMLTERVVEKEGFFCTYERFCRLLDEQPQIVRTVPAYIEIEVTTEVNSICSYSPLSYVTRKKGEMDIGAFKNILEGLKQFCGDFYVAFSYLGEPLLHTSIKSIIEYTLSIQGVELILETDGHLFTPDFSDYICGLSSDHLHIVFEVDAVTQEVYQRVHSGSLSKVERNIRYLLDSRPNNVYVQMVKMHENQHQMLQFFDIWEKEGASVIIQKYNSYLGLLPDRSSADLEPLERMCCWHLLRDMVVFNTGDVPRCRQDINMNFNLGNLLHHPIEEVWEKANQFYLKHCYGNYDEYCRVCDEYYSFNF